MASCAALLVLLSACGSGSGSGSDSADSAADGTVPEVLATASPAAGVYVAAGDADKVNTAGDKVWQASARATDTDAHKKCNKAPAETWAGCWHSLLDPVQAALGDLSDELVTFADKKYSASGCDTAIAGAKTTFTGFETRVTSLLAGIDSDERAAQEKAMNDYWGTFDAIGAGYNAPFQAITSACYSPEDVARANASASPTPTAA